MKMWQWIGLYVIIVGTMVVIHWLIHRHHTALVRSLIAGMDDLVAHYTSTLWRQRDHIYQYEENVGLLFRTMNDMVHDPRASYHQYRSRRYEDISYARSLLPDMFDETDLDHITETDESLGRIERVYQSWGLLLMICTLGLYMPRKKPLYVA